MRRGLWPSCSRGCKALARRGFLENLSLSLTYSEGGGFFRTLGPLSKLVYACATLAALFLAQDLPALLAVLSVALGLSALERGAPAKVLTLLRALAPLVLFVLVLNLLTSVTLGGAEVAEVLRVQLMAVLRVIAVAPPFVVLIATTTPLELVQVFSGLGIPYTALYPLIIAYRFAPIVFQELKAIYDAQRSRGIELERGSLLERARKLASLVVPVVVCSVIRARELAEALEARGFGYSRRRTFARPLRFRRRDAVFVALVVALYAAALLLCNQLSAWPPS